MIRTLQAGSVEYVWARIVDITGADISGTAVQLAVVPYGADPADWQTPDDLDRPTDDVIRAAALVTAAVGDDLDGRWQVYARLTDAPEQPILLCGQFRVRT